MTNKKKVDSQPRQDDFRPSDDNVKLLPEPRVIQLQPRIQAKPRRSAVIKAVPSVPTVDKVKMPKLPQGYIKARKHDPL